MKLALSICLKWYLRFYHLPIDIVYRSIYGFRNRKVMFVLLCFMVGEWGRAMMQTIEKIMGLESLGNGNRFMRKPLKTRNPIDRSYFPMSIEARTACGNWHQSGMNDMPGCAFFHPGAITRRNSRM